MTATQQFIEDAIKGGWRGLSMFSYWELHGEKVYAGVNAITTYDVSTFILQPSFWQAVGKTRGWEEEIYVVQAHLFMTALMAKSLSIEEALTAIS